MRIRLGVLRTIVLETMDQSYRRTRVVDMTPQRPDDIDPRKGSIAKGIEARDQGVEDEIEELRGMPEFSDFDSFMNYKLDNGEYTFSWIELQALARNVAARRVGHQAAVASKIDIEAVKGVLVDEMGFKFVPREIQKMTRGVADNSHGTHPFAGSGGGGTGFSTDRGGGGGFTSFGGGPGAIGSGTVWNPNDNKNLPMGSRRR